MVDEKGEWRDLLLKKRKYDETNRKVCQFLKMEGFQLMVFQFLYVLTFL